MQLPIRTVLQDNMGIELDNMQTHERADVKALLNAVILDGQTYPQVQPLSEEEFTAYWMNKDAFVVRVVDESEDKSERNMRTFQDTCKGSCKILGAFYLKPNFPGRCSHICNAGFIVQPSMRGKGIGRYMAENMLAIAQSKGYSAVMFNLIFATNIPSLNLWKSLGFSILGTIPKAVHLGDDRFIDAVMMYRSL
jgi:L-amino acid N-acyltransferase YncA